MCRECRIYFNSSNKFGYQSVFIFYRSRWADRLENVFSWTNPEDHHHWQSLQFVDEILQHSNESNAMSVLNYRWVYIPGIHQATIGEKLLLRLRILLYPDEHWPMLYCTYQNCGTGVASVWWCTCVVVHTIKYVVIIMIHFILTSSQR